MAVKFPVGTHPLEDELNKRVLAIARDEGYRIYIVGGYLRDALLFKQQGKIKDIDYAVETGTSGNGRSATKLAASIADRLEAHFVPLDETFDTARVVLDSGEILDFAGCVGANIESDVWRRDFSINALVWNPSSPEEIVDYVGGMADLEALRIRALSENVIVEDPLRILRAFRFAATLGGSIDKQTLLWIEAHRARLRDVAVERINYELFLVLGVLECAAEVELLASTGVLEALFPELVETRRVTPNAFHHLGLFEHSVETVPQIEARFKEAGDWVKESALGELSPGVTKLAATKLACLLHDIGKPQTWQINEDGRHTFYEHDRLGADMCKVISERMKWSRQVEKLIVALVRWHLRPGSLFHQGPPTDKAVRKFYRSMGDDTPELILLAFADFGATRGPGLMGENRKVLEQSMFDLLEGYQVYKEEARRRVRLLDGNEVMQMLSIKPGPVVGEILAALEEAQEFKEVLDRSQAELFVKQHYEQKYCK
jgi:putative nucleotidyltransferase with HDIG domain